MEKSKAKQKHPAYDVLVGIANGEQIEGKLMENGTVEWCPLTHEVALLFISKNHFISELRVKPKK